MSGRRALPVAFIALVAAAQVRAQDDEKAWRAALDTYWQGINDTFQDSVKSPLLPEDRAVFTELERFPVDAAFRVRARFKSKTGKDFGMPTTTDRRLRK